jgi:spoIIIJ-associated protein
MEWVETTGRTVEEAKEAALDQLGVDDSDAEFEILEEPKFGLFGRLRSGARVRARVRPTKPRPKDEHRDRRGRRRAGGPAGSASTTATGAEVAEVAEVAGVAKGAEDAAAAPPAEPAGRRRARASDGPAKTADVDVSMDDDTDDQVPEGEAAAASASGPRRSGRQRGRGPRTQGPDSDGQQADAGDTELSPAPSTRRRDSGPRRQPQASNDDSGSRGGGMEVSLDEQGAIAMEFLEGLVDRLNLDADFAMVRPDEDTVEINLEGDDLGMLIGAKGATLLAIQDLTRTVVQRKTSAGNGRLVVDVAGYRRKRKDALERFARRLAEEVQTTGTQRVLEPMSAADRKIVHDTANQFDGVATMSEGEDPNRRVVILPAPR